MVVKKSEYQNQYRSSVIKKHQAIYEENLNLRHQRRDREFVHTPICWDELSEEDAVVSSDSLEDVDAQSRRGKAQKVPAEQYQSLAEILSDARDKAEAARKRRTEDIGKSPVISEVVKDKIGDDPQIPKKVPSASKITLENGEEYNRQCEKDEKEVKDKSYSIYDIVEQENKKLNEKLAKTYVLNRGGKFQEDISDETDTDRDMKKADELKLQNKATITCENNLRKKTYTKKRQADSRERGGIRPPSGKHRGESRAGSAATSGKICNCPGYPANPKAEAVVPPLAFVPKVRRPDRRAGIPKAKRRTASPPVSVQEKPPFVSYGAGDIEDNMAIHRTHNVRAMTDVYLPALRAKSRREEQLKRQKLKEQRAQSVESLLDKLASVSPREVEDWESEYRRQYHGYAPKDYERAVSARAVVPRAAPIRAVHRGGCLVVHVD